VVETGARRAGAAIVGGVVVGVCKGTCGRPGGVGVPTPRRRGAVVSRVHAGGEGDGLDLDTGSLLQNGGFGGGGGREGVWARGKGRRRGGRISSIPP